MCPQIKWDVLKTEKVKKGRFEIIYETVQFSEEKVGPYSYIKYGADGVCILPILPDGRICLVSQYRRPVGTVQFEVPAGMIDIGESPETTAVRELMEETGLCAVKLIDCGYIYSSPGSTTEKMFLFIAYCEEPRQSDTEQDPSEKIELHFFTVDQAKQMITDNTIHHGSAQVLFCRFIEKF